MTLLKLKRSLFTCAIKINILFFSFPLENSLLQHWHLKERSWIKGCLPRYLVDKIIN